MNMKIKICGLTRICEAEYLNENDIDYAGFVFYKKSKRNITLSQALEIMDKLTGDIKRVAVMVSPTEEFIRQLNELPFDIYQIHGELTQEVLKACKRDVWRALNIESSAEITAFLNSLPNECKHVRGIVFDAPDFGSGKPFDWEGDARIEERLKTKLEIILAGGLNKDNVREGIRRFAPDVVDVSSAVEGCDGKDKNKIKAFADAVREA